MNQRKKLIDDERNAENRFRLNREEFESRNAEVEEYLKTVSKETHSSGSFKSTITTTREQRTIQHSTQNGFHLTASGFYKKPQNVPDFSINSSDVFEATRSSEKDHEDLVNASYEERVNVTDQINKVIETLDSDDQEQSSVLTRVTVTGADGDPHEQTERSKKKDDKDKKKYSTVLARKQRQEDLFKKPRSEKRNTIIKNYRNCITIIKQKSAEVQKKANVEPDFLILFKDVVSSSADCYGEKNV